MTRIMGQDPVPAYVMTPERVAGTRAIGLAQSIHASPELRRRIEEAVICPACRGSGRTGPRVRDGVLVDPPPPLCPSCAGQGASVPDGVEEVGAEPDVPRATLLPPRPSGLTLVGHPIDGRAWLVLQLPGGGVRCDGTEDICRQEARRLAVVESGAFAVFQPRGISAPTTTVTEELL